MVDNIKKNIVVETKTVNAQPAVSKPAVEDYQPMFNTNSDRTTPSSPSEPTEAQVNASVQSQAARAKHQQEEVEQNKLEAAINKMLQEQGLEPTYDNILKIAEQMRSNLIYKQTEEDLTPEEQAQLECINKMLSPSDSSDSAQAVNTTSLGTEVKTDAPETEQNNVSIEKILTGDFKQEDLKEFVLNYVKSTTKNFDSLTDAQKNELLKNLNKTLIKIATNGKKDNYSKMTNEELANASKMLLLCNSKKMSLEDFSKLKPQDRVSALKTFEVEGLKTLISKYTPKNVSPEEFKKFPPEKKLYSYIDEILLSKNPNYSEFSDTDKATERSKFIENLISKKLGVEEWNKLSEDKKASNIREFAKDLEVALYTDKPLSEIMKMDISKKSQLRSIVAEKNGYEVDKIDTSINSVISELRASGQKVNYQNIIAKLEKQAKNGDEDAKLALQAVNTSIEYGKYSKTSKFDTSVKDFEDKMLNGGYKDASELIGVSIKNKDINTLKNAAAYYQSKLTPKDWETFKKLIEAGDFTEAEKREIYSVSGQIMSLRHARAAVTHNVNAYKQSEQMLHATDHFDIAENAARVAGKYFKDGKFDDISTNSMKVWGAAITPALTEGMNNRNIMSFAESQRHARNLMSSSDISGECKSAFTFNIVKSANNKQEVLGYGSQLSKITDPAVTEGLAAIESFVKENYGSDVSKQYSSYVDNAIKNNGYSSDEISNINTARETGQTSYERNAVSSDSNNTSNTNSTSANSTSNKVANNTITNPASAQTSNATANTVSTTSSTPAKVKVSSANSNAVAEMKAQIAQVNYEHSIALRDKALADLERVIDKIQNDQQVRAEKQAELAKKEAKTDEEIAQAIKEAEAKSVEEQKAAQEQITKETIAEIEQQEKLEKKYHISAETIEILRNAQKQGDLSTIYTKLGEISADAQKHFVQYLSRKDTATIIGFIRNQSSNKALIKELCMLNPGLIKALDPDLLLNCGIPKNDIIKYSDSHQLSVLLYELAKVGNNEELRQFYDVLGSDSQHVASMPSKPVPGDDRYFAMLNKNMSTASNKVAMRYDIDKKVPRELWG